MYGHGVVCYVMCPFRGDCKAHKGILLKTWQRSVLVHLLLCFLQLHVCLLLALADLVLFLIVLWHSSD